MTQTITLAEVKAAALKAHKEGRLLAQAEEGVAPYGYKVLCQDGVERVCAIGACLNQESLDAIDEQGLNAKTLQCSSSYLREVFDYDRTEFHALYNIQQAHDDWLSIQGDTRAGDRTIESREHYFLELIRA